MSSTYLILTAFLHHHRHRADSDHSGAATRWWRLLAAFGGAGGGGGTESVFGGRVGDALTFMTIAFCIYLLLAITLNLMESETTAAPVLTPTDAVVETAPDGEEVLVLRDEAAPAEDPLVGPARRSTRNLRATFRRMSPEQRLHDSFHDRLRCVSDVVEGRQFSIEIRALNGKHLKCHVRLPEELSGLEPKSNPSCTSGCPGAR